MMWKKQHFGGQLVWQNAWQLNIITMDSLLILTAKFALGTAKLSSQFDASNHYSYIITNLHLLTLQSCKLLMQPFHR